MNSVLYKEVDLLIDEKFKEIIINPKGERFYFVACEAQNSIYYGATLVREEDGTLMIEGEQELYTIHKDSGRSYQKLLCLHPAELIRKRWFLGITWYCVHGVLKRRVKSRYRCKHVEYTIHERLERLSQSIEER